MDGTSTRVSRFFDLSSMPTLTHLDFVCGTGNSIHHCSISHNYSERHWDNFYCYYQHSYWPYKCIRDIMKVKVIKKIYMCHFVPNILQMFYLIVK